MSRAGYREVKAAESVAKKPRADKGKKHTPGAGRPAGTGKPLKPVDSGLQDRVKNIDAWLTKNKAIIKAAGIATKARMTGSALDALRAGSRVATEVEVASVENAGRSFGYDKAKTY